MLLKRIGYEPSGYKWSDKGGGMKWSGGQVVSYGAAMGTRRGHDGVWRISCLWDWWTDCG